MRTLTPFPQISEYQRHRITPEQLVHLLAEAYHLTPTILTEQFLMEHERFMDRYLAPETSFQERSRVSQVRVTKHFAMSCHERPTRFSTCSLENWVTDELFSQTPIHAAAYLVSFRDTLLRRKFTYLQREFLEEDGWQAVVHSVLSAQMHISMPLQLLPRQSPTFTQMHARLCALDLVIVGMLEVLLAAALHGRVDLFHMARLLLADLHDFVPLGPVTGSPTWIVVCR